MRVAAGICVLVLAGVLGAGAASAPVAPAASLKIAIDLPDTEAVTGPFIISGWAADTSVRPGPGVDAVHVYAFPEPGSGAAPIFLAAAELGRTRDDVGAVFGPGFERTGFELSAHGLAPGAYALIVYAQSAQSGETRSSRRDVMVESSLQVVIDSTSGGAELAQLVSIEGWAADPAAIEGTGVDALHVYAHSDGAAPTFLGAAKLELPRPDVGAVLGDRFIRSGFQLTFAGLADGEYSIVAYAAGTLGVVRSAAVRVAIGRKFPRPVMAIDGPASGSVHASSWAVNGWAIDRGAPSGAGVDAVHVWAFPADGAPAIFVGPAAYGWTRSDVGVVFGGAFAASGFQLLVSGLPAGVYDIGVYARSTVSQTFNQARFVRVTMAPPPPPVVTTARYRVTFESTWSPDSHPDDFQPSATILDSSAVRTPAP